MAAGTVAALSRLTGREVATVALDRGLPGREPRTLRGFALGDGPAVVLVAGAGEAALTWAPVVAGLSADARVVVYDRAGLGDSDPLPLASGAAALDDLSALLAATGPAVLVGHSWGGLLAQLAAWRRPSLVTGLVLLDPTHEAVRIPRHLRLAAAASFAGMRALHRAGLADGLVRSMGRQLAGSSTEDPETRELVAAAYAASYAGPAALPTVVAENRVADRCRPWVAPLRAAAPPLPGPVVVLSATRQPAWLQAQTGDLHHEVATAAGGTFRPVDTGHYVHRERPDLVLSAVAEVLGC